MRVDQLIADHRMRLMAVVRAAPSVREGCRRAGIHHSTYYDWLHRLEAEGLEGLTPRHSRTRVKSPGRIRLEAQVVAQALAHPPWGPQRLRSELARAGVGVGSESQVWRILKSHHLNRAGLRYQVMAVARGLTTADAVLAAEEPARVPSRRWTGHLTADQPEDLARLPADNAIRQWKGRNPAYPDLHATFNDAVAASVLDAWDHPERRVLANEQSVPSTVIPVEFTNCNSVSIGADLQGRARLDQVAWLVFFSYERGRPRVIALVKEG